MIFEATPKQRGLLLSMLHPYLYHGTTATRAAQIKRDGLKADEPAGHFPGATPRGAIYLSDAAAPHFATIRAHFENDAPTIARVHIGALNLKRLAPDEDFLAALLWAQSLSPEQMAEKASFIAATTRSLEDAAREGADALAPQLKASMEPINQAFAQQLETMGFDGENGGARLWEYRALWQTCWRAVGTVAYFGDIPAPRLDTINLDLDVLKKHGLGTVFGDQIVQREVIDAAFDSRGMDAALSAQNWPRFWLMATERFSEGGLAPNSFHGPIHWLDVEHHARRIALETGADETVCRLFAWFHDVARQNEESDPQHGPRAAAWLESKRDELGTLSPTQWDILRYAIQSHTSGKTSSSLTAGACFDADRLDLARFGIETKPELLSTESARKWQANRAKIRADFRPQSVSRWFATV